MFSLQNLSYVLGTLKPIYVEDCLGEHRVRSLARVGSINMAKQILGVCFRLAATIALSRLLPPSTFGLIAMVTFFRGLMDMVSGSGFIEAAIQKKNLSLDELNGVFWLNLSLSVALAIVFILCGPLIAYFYGEPEITAICLVIGLLYILENLFKTHDALLSRTMNAELSFVIFLVPQIINLPVAIVLALLGFGVWALIGASVFSAIAQRLLFMYFVRWDPKGFKKTTGFPELLRYGFKAMSASVVNYCSMYSQNLALGKFASPADVGFYNRGQSIFLMPIQLVSQPIAQMILPSLSVLQDQKEKLLALLLRATWLVVLIVMPFTLFMVFFGDWAVVLLLGERWQVSGEVTQWLAVASVPYLASNLIARGNAAIGRPGRGVPLAIASLPFLLGGVVVYAPSGPVAVAIVYAAYRWLYYPLFLAMHLRGSGFLVREFLSSQLALLSICALTSIILIFLREIGNDFLGIIQVGYMCICLFVSYITFLVVCRYFKYGREVVAWLHSKLSKQLPPLGILTRTRR